MRTQKPKTESEQFFDALALLAISTQYEMDELTMRAYRIALEGVPLEFVEKACEELAREPLSWFPKAGDIRARAEKIAARRQPAKALPSGATSTGYACVECKDTGWKYVGHNAVVECECRPTNPNYQATHPRTAAAPWDV
jgi:hypothetical protein